MTRTTEKPPRLPENRLLEEEERFAYMGSLLSGMIHNLNNPLNAVMGVSQLMELRLPDDRDVPRLLKYIDELANLLREVTAKVQFEERLPEVDDLPAWLKQQLRFYRCHLGFKHGVEVVLELDSDKFPAVAAPGLPLTTFFFRFIDWISHVIDHKQKAKLLLRGGSQPQEPVLLLELQLAQPGAATAESMTDMIDLLAEHGIGCELDIRSDTELTWQLTLPLPAEGRGPARG